MIALPQELPLVEWHKRRSVPLSEGWLAESIEISANNAGMPEWHWTADIAKAISYYLRSEFTGSLITPRQLQLLIKRSLVSIGYPELAKTLVIVPPRVNIHLAELARQGQYELIFFSLLRTRLDEARKLKVKGIRLEGLRECTKVIQQTRRWQEQCDKLADEIVAFTRCHLNTWNGKRIELVVR